MNLRRRLNNLIKARSGFTDEADRMRTLRRIQREDPWIEPDDIQTLEDFFAWSGSHFEPLPERAEDGTLKKKPLNMNDPRQRKMATFKKRRVAYQNKNKHNLPA